MKSHILEYNVPVYHVRYPGYDFTASLWIHAEYDGLLNLQEVETLSHYNRPCAGGFCLCFDGAARYVELFPERWQIVSDRR